MDTLCRSVPGLLGAAQTRVLFPSVQVDASTVIDLFR
jgi:hypothetical protein